MTNNFLPNESPSDLWFERSNFAGTMLGCVSYGIHLCVFTTTIFLMLNDKSHKKLSSWHYAYLCTVFSLGTFQIAGNIKFFEDAWINSREIPGGPAAWITEHFSDPVNTLASAAYIIAVLLQDGMLVYRLLVVWDYRFYVAIIPVLGLLASTVLSVLSVIQSAQPDSSFWSQTTIQFLVPYFSLSIGLNIAMTLAISGRMLYLRGRIVSALGKQHAHMYTSIAAMFIESGAVYSVLGLIFIISYAKGSNVQNLVLQSLDQAVGISPELIILRSSLGRAWTRDLTARTQHGVSITHTGSTRLKANHKVKLVNSNNTSDTHVPGEIGGNTDDSAIELKTYGGLIASSGDA